MENTNNETGFVSIGTTTNTNEPSTIKIVKPDILVEIDNLKKKVVELLEAEKLEKLATAQNPRTLEEVFMALDAKLQEILVAINSIRVFPIVYPQPTITPDPNPYPSPYEPWRIPGPTWICHQKETTCSHGSESK